MESFDEERGSGTVVLDDGTTLPFAGSVFAASALRYLRPGQRLTVVVAGEGAGARVEAFNLGSVGYVPPSPAAAEKAAKKAKEPPSPEDDEARRRRAVRPSKARR